VADMKEYGFPGQVKKLVSNPLAGIRAWAAAWRVAYRRAAET
jgi:hypothetical protein